MINFNKKSDCAGCGACANICPKKAITLKRDDEGFLFPIVDREKCTDCGLCEKVCDFRLRRDLKAVEAKNADTDNNTTEDNAAKITDAEKFAQKYYAAFNNDKAVVKKSSSGGIFSLISDYIIEQGGSVYGVYLDEAFVVRTGRAVDKSGRNRFIGSKYVQSNASVCFDSVCQDLRAGLKVMFTGTPCQTGALKSLVAVKNVDDANLYLVDFICHGVASPRVWKDYTGYLKKRWGGLGSYVFRGKKKGWHGWYPVINTTFGDVSEKHKNEESFILMYQTLNFNRRSCFKCPYTSYERTSDITLADFWNVDSFAKHMDDNTGTSELLVNTKKGMELLEAKADMMTVYECSSEQAWQPHLEYPNHLPKTRREFWDMYEDHGIEAVVVKYGKGDAMTKLKNTVTPVLKKTGLYVAFGKMYKKIFVKK